MPALEVTQEQYDRLAKHMIDVKRNADAQSQTWRVNPEKKTKVVELYRRFGSIKIVCRDLHLSASTVTDILNEMGGVPA